MSLHMFNTVPVKYLCTLSELISCAKKANGSGTHAWWNAYNNNWYKDNTPLRDGKRNVVAGLYHITVPFVLSGYLCFRFQHTNHTKVVKIHKVISIVINSILWNHTNQQPAASMPCHQTSAQFHCNNNTLGYCNVEADSCLPLLNDP